MGLARIAAYLASLILVFLGVIFLLASAYAASRLFVGAILTVLGLGIAFLAWRSPPQVTVKHEVQMPGTLRVSSLICPNCGAGLEPSKMRIQQAGPSIKCPYCGNEFEVTEESKW